MLLCAARCLLQYAGPLVVLWWFQMLLLLSHPWLSRPLARLLTRAAHWSLASYTNPGLATALWDLTMSTLHCCGRTDYTDLAASTAWINSRQNKQVYQHTVIM